MTLMLKGRRGHVWQEKNPAQDRLGESNSMTY